MEFLYTVLGIVLSEIYSKLKKTFYKWNVKKMFEGDLIEKFFLVYGEMLSDPTNPMEWPYVKPGVPGRFKISSALSGATMRSFKYLLEAFGKAGITPKITSDYLIRSEVDVSFISIGGRNNYKTNDFLNRNENNFFDFEITPGTSPGIFVKNNPQKRFCIDNEHDYGFIIKIILNNFKEKRVWVAIAGLGEWGTSGAAWFYFLFSSDCRRARTFH